MRLVLSAVSSVGWLAGRPQHRWCAVSGVHVLTRTTHLIDGEIRVANEQASCTKSAQKLKIECVSVLSVVVVFVGDGFSADEGTLLAEVHTLFSGGGLPPPPN